MQKRRAKCHNLDRVIGARKDAQGWAATVDRMRALPGSGISESEAQTILSYLTLQNRPDGSASAAKKRVRRGQRRRAADRRGSADHRLSLCDPDSESRGQAKGGSRRSHFHRTQPDRPQSRDTGFGVFDRFVPI
jgi:hypothetical protein